MPDPLHPAIVHFPIVLAVLLPIAAVAAVLAARAGIPARTTWIPVAVLAGMLALSAWVAVETGEDQEETAEQAIVAEGVIHDHEEAAEAFLIASGVLFAVMLVGLAPGKPGQYARIGGTLATGIILGMAFRVGSSGGDLVYKYGAAQAYTGDVMQIGEGVPYLLKGVGGDDDADDDR